MGLAALVPLVSHAQTEVLPTEVLPGESLTLGPFDYTECDTTTDSLQFFDDGKLKDFGDVPTVNCDLADAAAGSLRVRAGPGLKFSIKGPIDEDDEEPTISFPDDEDLIRYGVAIGRIGQTIQIPEPVEGEVGMEVLAAQVSTEIEWAGLLWNRKPFIPAWTQVVATLQVRDLTTGLVVASNTFLDERLDLGNNLPTDYWSGALNPIFGWTSLRSSTGADLTAQLVRGRDYRIEIEAKCEDLGPLVVGIFPFQIFGGVFNVSGFITGGGCFFSDATDRLVTSLTFSTRFDPGGGFQVSPVTVTVQDDVKAKLAQVLENLDKDDKDRDGVRDDIDMCPDTSIPEGVPTSRLGKIRFALVDDDLIFDTNPLNGVGPKTTFTTADTGGCSCEQIIAALRLGWLGRIHKKFGCGISVMKIWFYKISRGKTHTS
jgi:hypothetical protein